MKGVMFLLGTSLLLLSACGQEDTGVPPEEFEESNQEALTNWPGEIPVYPGSRVESSREVDGGMVMNLRTSDSVEAVINFYKDALQQNDWRLLSELQSGESTILAAEKGEWAFAASAKSDDGETTMAMGVRKKE